MLPNLTAARVKCDNPSVVRFQKGHKLFCYFEADCVKIYSTEREGGALIHSCRFSDVRLAFYDINCI